MSTYSRTTFYTIRRPGAPVSAVDNSLIVSGHRRGHWSKGALLKLAKDMGGELVSAYSIMRDSKGFMPLSKEVIA